VLRVSCFPRRRLNFRKHLQSFMSENENASMKFSPTNVDFLIAAAIKVR
jgi:hypothetical protein